MKRASAIPRAGKEVVMDAAKLTYPEARALIRNYYDAQEARKRADMQMRHAGDVELAPCLKWYAESNTVIEGELIKMFTKFAENSAVGRWCLSHHGVGPVLATGFIANLDITKAPTVGHFWRFSGMDPTCKWEKGQKRPYNPDMKQLCFHMGECAKRLSGHPDSFYGGFWRERKTLLETRNAAGLYAERAKIYVTKSADVKKTLAKGMLPPGNLDRQAGNITAKMFLSHLHAVMFWDHYGVAPPKPFAIDILGHAHEVKIPHIDMFPGFEKAYYGKAGDRKSASARGLAEVED